MRTIKTKVYKFAELSEEAKKEAIEVCQEYNLDYDWYQFTYEDAEQAGIKIQGFDIDRGSYCDIKFIDGPTECARLIINNHGKTCGTFKTAQKFLSDYEELVKKFSDGKRTDIVEEGKEYDFDTEADDLCDEFKKDIAEDYLIILRQNYEYRSSEEAIKETIEANEYEFTKDGKRF
jgi:hypothetical protein